MTEEKWVDRCHDQVMFKALTKSLLSVPPSVGFITYEKPCFACGMCLRYGAVFLLLQLLAWMD